MKHRKQRAFTLIELIIVLSILFVLFGLVGGCNRPATGTKIGQVVKITQSGFMSKTWEAELIRGGFSSGSGTMGVKFDFTVPDDQADTVRKFMETQTEVLMSYRTKGIYSPFSSDSHGNFMTDIRSAKPTPSPTPETEAQ